MITLDFKKQIAEKLMSQKKELLEQLLQTQKERLEDVNEEDIDNADPVESPKQQMMNDITVQASLFDHVNEEIEALKRLNLEIVHNQVSLGSLIRANTGYYFVGVVSEETVVNDKKIRGISTSSPLYQKMAGLKANTEFQMGKISYVILEIV